MALSYSNVKTLRPNRGVRQAIMDVTLDNSYDNGGWSIAASAITAAAGGILNRIFNLVPPANKSGYSFEWVPVAGNATGKLKALINNVSQSFQEAALAEYTAYPAYTATEQAAALAKCLDGSSYANLAVTAAEAGYTANYQLFPDTPVAGDAVLFGGAVPFAQLGIDMSATVCVYDAAGVVGWDYWNGSAWADLPQSSMTVQVPPAQPETTSVSRTVFLPLSRRRTGLLRPSTVSLRTGFGRALRPAKLLTSRPLV
jgi:hypothetical protein